MKNLAWKVWASIALILSPFLAPAQNECGQPTLDQAKRDFEYGRFDDVLSKLSACLKEKTGVSAENRGFRENAYIRLTMTYLAVDSLQQAESNARKLLDINPAFSVRPEDPMLFKQIVEEIRNAQNEVMVVSVSKKNENLFEAPATVSLLTSKTIRERGYNDVEAALHDLPGFDISRSNGLFYSNIYQRGYRSTNTNRTMILVDGVEDNDLWSNVMTISRQYALTNVKSMEVVYGPASTMYGANAYLGVVSLNTKNPEDYIKDGKRFGMQSMAGYGSWNTAFADVSAAYKISPAVSFVATGRVFQSNEQDLSDYTEFDYKTSEFDSDYHTGFYNSKMKLSKTSALAFVTANGKNHPYYIFSPLDTTVTLSAAGAKRALELDNKSLSGSFNGKPIGYEDRTESYSFYGKLKIHDFTLGLHTWKTVEGPGSWYNDSRYAQSGNGTVWAPQNTFLYARYDKQVSSNLSFFNYSQYKIHQFGPENQLVRTRNYSNGILNLSNLVKDTEPFWERLLLYQISKQLRNETRLLFKPNEKMDGIIGTEIRLSDIQGDYYYTYSRQNLPDTAVIPIPEEEGAFIGPTNIPGGNHFSARDLGAFAQITHRFTPDLKVTGGLRYDMNITRRTVAYNNVVNPRLAVVYSPGKIIAKFIYSTAFKDATYWDKFSTVSGSRDKSNPKLKSEKVKNYEVSAGFFPNKDFRVQAEVYRADYSNIIGTTTVPYKKPTGETALTLQNVNIGRQRVYGIQTDASYKHGELEMYANYSYTHSFAIDPVDDAGKPVRDAATGETITRLKVGDIAPHKANIGATYSYKGITGHLRTNIIGMKPSGKGTTVPTNPLGNFKAYSVFFASVGYDIPSTGISIQANLNNIFNLEYFSPGLREAKGDFASRLPQNRRNGTIRMLFEF